MLIGNVDLMSFQFTLTSENHDTQFRRRMKSATHALSSLQVDQTMNEVAHDDSSCPQPGSLTPVFLWLPQQIVTASHPVYVASSPRSVQYYRTVRLKFIWFSELKSTSNVAVSLLITVVTASAYWIKAFTACRTPSCPLNSWLGGDKESLPKCYRITTVKHQLRLFHAYRSRRVRADWQFTVWQFKFLFYFHHTASLSHRTFSL